VCVGLGGWVRGEGLGIVGVVTGMRDGDAGGLMNGVVREIMD